MSNEIILRKVIKTDKDIRQKFIEKRLKLGVSQKTLAQLAHTDQANISRFEHGKNINLDTFEHYVNALGQTIDWKKMTQPVMTQKPAGIGISYIEGTITWGEIMPGDSRITYVTFEEPFDKAPTVSLQFESGFNNLLLASNITRTGFYVCIKNIMDTPQAMAISWTASR